MNDMSNVLQTAIKTLSARIGDGFTDGTAKFVIEGEGAIIIDAEGVRAGDEDADVTLTAAADVFRQILDGDLDPTSAFMSGRLSVAGDMGLAMKLGSALA
ncbi:MAG: SCP2 sterol-binding domain-containing protein [Roseovarius sp.]